MTKEETMRQLLTINEVSFGRACIGCIVIETAIEAYKLLKDQDKEIELLKTQLKMSDEK